MRDREVPEVLAGRAAAEGVDGAEGRSPAQAGEMAEAVARAFGPSLRPWPPRALTGFALPDQVSRFLAQHGLPVDPPPPLVRFVSAPLVLVAGARGGREVLLGHCDKVQMRMQEGTGEIVASGPSAGAPGGFVNSSLLHLLECLRRYGCRLDELRRVDQDGAIDIAEDLRQEVRLVDPRALADGESWWSRVLEQVEAGFC